MNYNNATDIVDDSVEFAPAASVQIDAFTYVFLMTLLAVCLLVMCVIMLYKMMTFVQAEPAFSNTQHACDFKSEQADVDVTEGDLPCTRCNKHRRSIAFAPCGHFYSCIACATGPPAVSQCIICGTPVLSSVFVIDVEDRNSSWFATHHPTPAVATTQYVAI